MTKSSTVKRVGIGLVSMIFAGVGGYIGAHYARRMNSDVLRVIVVCTGCAMAAYFFWRQG